MEHGSTSHSLAGLKILIVEDDYFVASECATVLREHGAEVFGPVPDMPRARATLVHSGVDCVLLDVNLKGEMVFGLADELRGRGTPMVFTTGYDTSFLPPPLRDAACLQKPVESAELVRAVRRVTGGPLPA